MPVLGSVGDVVLPFGEIPELALFWSFVVVITTLGLPVVVEGPGDFSEVG